MLEMFEKREVFPMSHPLTTTSTVKRPAMPYRDAPIPQWPSYTGVSQFVGASPSESDRVR